MGAHLLGVLGDTRGAALFYGEAAAPIADKANKVEERSLPECAGRLA
ncbi:hypothetical protein [Nocardiopsis ansamitocini]|uniref:Uncharacterized protein n=1 Tax=Nocardiopsis ansamitocini TaxID=1670832 RepID=A0A9W6UJW1_9ACTN|nr:hypothetical protein [Nocardiopsis ansamitocini]GLU48470.1 hypothetical protein Nans01_28210 [Nocardiopsis ansamitocini]